MLRTQIYLPEEYHQELAVLARSMSVPKAVIIRKISNGNRSKKGADILGVLLSVVETLKIQGKNPLNEMRKIIQASEN